MIVEPSPQRAQTTATADDGARDGAPRNARTSSAIGPRSRPMVSGSRVLANVASAEELQLALGAGAEGIGLLRTELAFLDAARVADRAASTPRRSTPILAACGERPAVVRVLDFGADKAPPFLHGERAARRSSCCSPTRTRFARAAARDRARGAATATCGSCCRWSTRRTQLARVARLLEQLALSSDVRVRPPLGSMIETPAAARGRGGDRRAIRLPQHRHERPDGGDAGRRPVRSRTRARPSPARAAFDRAQRRRRARRRDPRSRSAARRRPTRSCCRCSSASESTSSASGRRASEQVRRWIRRLDADRGRAGSRARR